jgi:hypothetical protein
MMLSSVFYYQSIYLALIFVPLLTSNASSKDNPYASSSEFPISIGDAWSSYFYKRMGEIPSPSPACQVCFYEKKSFKGEKFCIGKKTKNDTNIFSVNAPSTIGSIKFFNKIKDCDLVANLRLLDPPFGQHVEAVTCDTETGVQDVVQEIFVEQKNTACLLAAKEVDKFGRCYTKSVSKIEKTYDNTFYELLLFTKTPKDLGIFLYQNPNFNQDNPGLFKFFNTSSNDFTIPKENAALGDTSFKTLQYKVSSIEFVPGNTSIE